MKKEEMKISDLYSLENTMAKELLEQFTYPWEVLAHIGDFVERLGETLPKDEYANPAEGIWIHKSAHIAPTAGIIAPVGAIWADLWIQMPISHRPQALSHR